MAKLLVTLNDLRSHTLLMAALRAAEKSPETLTEYLSFCDDAPATAAELDNLAEHINTADQASAQLLAASPDLLAALDAASEILAHYLTGDRLDPALNRAFNNARAAMVKARGVGEAE